MWSAEVLLLAISISCLGVVCFLFGVDVENVEHLFVDFL
jgi:hypothetical protein